MKSLFILLSVLFISNAQASRGCILNTDDVTSEVLNDPKLTWDYLSSNSDCKITPMHVSWYFGPPSKDVEIIAFEYEIDPGHHGIMNSMIGFCYREMETSKVICKKDSFDPKTL